MSHNLNRTKLAGTQSSPVNHRIRYWPALVAALVLLAGCGGGGGSGERGENSLPSFQLSDGDVISGDNNVIRIAASDDTGIASVTTRLLRQGVMEECAAELDVQLVANTLLEACLADQPSCVVDFIPSGDEIVVFPPPLYAPIGLEYEISLIDRDGSATDPVQAVFCLDVGENAAPRPAADTFQLIYPSTIQRNGVNFTGRCEKQAGSDGLLLNDDDDEHVTNSCLQAELLTTPAFASNEATFAASFGLDGGFRYEGFGDIPPAGSNGRTVDSFTYRVSDGVNPPSAPITVEIVFSGENSPPLAQNDSFTVEEDSELQSLDVLANDSDPDALPLLINGVSNGPVNGIANILNGVLIEYQPNADFVGVDQFSYTAVDSGGLSVSANVEVQVTGVNDPPVATNDSATIAENTAVTVQVLNNDSDPEGDSLSVQSVASPINGSTTLNPDGSITYTPAPGFSGTDAFEYTITDGNGGTDTATAVIEVLFVNVAPAPVADELELAEGGVATLNVLANDIDADDDDLEIVEVGEASNGTVVLVSASTVQYTPAANFSGTDRFSYTVSDGTVVATSEVVVTVLAVNGLPVAVNDNAATSENTPVTIDVLGNDSDPDGDALTIVEVGTPSAGSATLVGGNIVYQPNTGFSGEDSFVYQIEDNNGESSSALVRVTVSNVNSEPVAVADAAATSENTPVSISVLANDSDPDGTTADLTLTIVTPPANGDASVSGDAIVYDPDTGFAGTDSLEYQIEDADGATANASVTISVAQVNGPPLAANDTATTLQGVAVTINVLSNDSDPDDDDLTLSVTEAPASGSAVPRPNGSILYTPIAGFAGIDSFTYEISDTSGEVSDAVVTVTVTEVNSEPVAVDDEAGTLQGTPVTIDVLGNDSDENNDSLSVSIASPASSGEAVVAANNNIVYTPLADFVGDDSFGYLIEDGNGGEATATVTVTVTSANTAPEAIADAVTVASATAVIVDVLANDSDPDQNTLTITGVDDPDNGNAELLADGTIRYISTAGFAGVDTFQYTISDGNNGVASATVSVTVLAANTPPVAMADQAETLPEVPVVVDVLANDSDQDQDTLSITDVEVPLNGVAELLTDGTIRYTSTAGFAGTETFQYTISDGNEGVASAAVSINVQAVNASPVAVADQAETSTEVPVAVDVLANDSDPDEDILSITSIEIPLNGTAELLTDGTISYTSEAGFAGTDTFQYTISDGNEGVATATVSISVLPVNNLPIAVADLAETLTEVPVVVDVLANDSDPDQDILSVTDIEVPPNGIAELLADGTISYTSIADFTGTDVFQYFISDGNDGVASAAIEIVVNPLETVTETDPETDGEPDDDQNPESAPEQSPDPLQVLENPDENSISA